jgi:uncharacterized YigZ family protein
VYKQAKAEIIEKKSRFIATVAPVYSEDAARAFLLAMKKQYWDATHNVYAYRVGLENEIIRFSDDGEPGGSAGMPTLDILVGEDVKNVVVNTTRYFGGTLLGVGGLVRAYGGAAKEGIAAAGVIEKIKCAVAVVSVSYTVSSKVRREAEKKGYIINNIEYTDNVKFQFLVQSDIGVFTALIADLTGGAAAVAENGYVYGFWRNEKFITDCENKEADI